MRAIVEEVVEYNQPTNCKLNKQQAMPMHFMFMQNSITLQLADAHKKIFGRFGGIFWVLFRIPGNDLKNTYLFGMNFTFSPKGEDDLSHGVVVNQIRMVFMFKLPSKNCYLHCPHLYMYHY